MKAAKAKALCSHPWHQAHGPFAPVGVVIFALLKIEQCEILGFFFLKQAIDGPHYVVVPVALLKIEESEIP